jgi:hypothetical protein
MGTNHGCTRILRGAAKRARGLGWQAQRDTAFPARPYDQASGPLKASLRFESAVTARGKQGKVEAGGGNRFVRNCR